jgi:hypothetical protein
LGYLAIQSLGFVLLPETRRFDAALLGGFNLPADMLHAVLHGIK